MKKMPWSACAGMLLCSLGVGGCTLLTGLLPALRASAADQAGTAELLRSALSALRPLPVLAAPAVSAFFFCVFRALYTGRDGWVRALYRRRLPLSAALFALCVALNLNNTSLARWMTVAAQADAASAPLWGMARGIRSDEWAVWSAFTLAQSAEGWPAVSPLIAGGGTDALWISVGGIPALSPALLLKPLYWGFPLFGADRGFSFLFAGRMLLLFHVSHELALEYTGGRKKWSVAAAFLLTFSPGVQWWFSQSPAEVLIFGQGILLCLIRSLRASRASARLAWSAGAAWCLGCYVMIGYPPWLISCLYLILPAAALLLVRSRKRPRPRDLPLYLLPALASLGLVGFLAYGSRETLGAVLASVYPGARLSTGGGAGPELLAGPGAVLIPLIRQAGFNPSETSSFALLPGLGLFLAAAGMIRTKKKDPFGILLIAAELFLGAFAFFGFPPFLARITLLSRVNRPEMALGVADTILLVRAAAAGPSFSRKTAGAAAGAFFFLYLFCSRACLPAPLPAVAAVALAGAAVIPGLLGGAPRRNLPAGAPEPSRVSALPRRRGIPALCLLCALALAGGAFVNPLQRGLACVENLAPVRALKALDGGPGETWLAEGDWPLSNLPLLAGKRTVCCTQPYPDPDFWAELDPAGTYRDCYNRFCNITVALTDAAPTAFSNPSEDHLLVALNFDDLEKLGVTHVMTARNLPERIGRCAFELLREEGGFRFYRLRRAET